MLLAYNFEAAGFEVSLVGSGVGAVDQLVAAQPDVVLLDWELPGLSGIEVLRLLSSRLGAELPPTLMLTGRNDREDRQRAILTGARGFISKPFSMAELLYRVDHLIVAGSPVQFAEVLPANPKTAALVDDATVPHQPL